MERRRGVRVEPAARHAATRQSRCAVVAVLLYCLHNRLATLPTSWVLTGAAPGDRGTKRFGLAARAAKDDVPPPALPAPDTSLASQSTDDNSADNKVASVQFLNDRFDMLYTCGRCDARNAISVSRIAWTQGVIVATCQGCKAKHLLADSGGLLDLTNETAFRNVVEFVEASGSTVKRLDKGDTAAMEALNLTIDEQGRVRLLEEASTQGEGDIDGSTTSTESGSTGDVSPPSPDLSASNSDTQDLEVNAIRTVVPPEGKPGDTLLLSTEFGRLHVVVPADATAGSTLEVGGLLERKLDLRSEEVHDGFALEEALPDGSMLIVRVSTEGIEDQVLRLGYPVTVVASPE
mmetsp:Transcript_7747/g.17193  ORF Transcript_7747/g.17193 Transcript_7747/m.17193 type:complete len:348 (+) Transcript_7747:56-1099(+)